MNARHLMLAFGFTPKVEGAAQVRGLIEAFDGPDLCVWTIDMALNMETGAWLTDEECDAFVEANGPELECLIRTSIESLGASASSH